MNPHPRPFTAEDLQRAAAARKLIPPEEGRAMARGAAAARWSLGAHDRRETICLVCSTSLKQNLITLPT